MLEPIARYYSAKLAAHGATSRGVDWNSETSQERRFTELLRVVDDRGASVNDYGCGYGALAARLRRDGYTGAYHGYDVAPAMVSAASELHATTPTAAFTSDRAGVPQADYTLASGIFNVRLDAPIDRWEAHVRATLADMAALSRRGFAFNALTSFSDPERMRDDLYYADPASWFTHCMTTFSRRVALLHDYPLYEFTILVRLQTETLNG